MPTERFKRSIALNLAYWLQAASDTSDAAIHHMDREHHNILRAVQFGLEVPESRQDTSCLILEMFVLIERRGYWRQWIPSIVSAIEHLEPSDKLLRMRLFDQLGQCYRLDRRWEEAVAAHKEAESAARMLADIEGLAKTHLHLSQVFWGTRDYDSCAQYGNAALREFLMVPDVDPQHVGAVSTILGLQFYGRGEYEDAERELYKAVATYRRLEEPALLGRSLMNLALSLEASGKPDMALVLYEEALAVLAETEHELDKVRVELSLGTLHINAGRWREAEAAFKRADSAYLHSSGLVYYQALTANNLGNTYLEMDRLEEAERYLRKSIALWQAASGSLMLANTIGTLAEVKVAQNESETAATLYEQATEITVEYPEDAWGRRLHKKFMAALGELRTAIEPAAQKEFCNAPTVM